jgi:hypothetical protein
MKKCNIQIIHPVVCRIMKKEFNTWRSNTTIFIYQYSCMFRPREVNIRLALEHFKRNIQTALTGNKLSLLPQHTQRRHNIFTIKYIQK